MKHLMTSMLLVAIGLAAPLGGCATTGQADESVAAARMDDTAVEGQHAVLTVYGMSCPLCANNVDEKLKEVPGVTAVNVDMDSGRATVTLDGKTRVTRRQLAGAVDKSGFSLRRVEAR